MDYQPHTFGASAGISAGPIRGTAFGPNQPAAPKPTPAPQPAFQMPTFNMPTFDWQPQAPPVAAAPAPAPAEAPSIAAMQSPLPTDESQPTETPDVLRQGIGARIPPSLNALLTAKVY